MRAWLRERRTDGDRGGAAAEQRPGAAQIDRRGNLTGTVMLPGGGGAPEIATNVRDVVVRLKQTPRAFVERLDFCTSVGDRVRVVVTDLGVLELRDWPEATTAKPSPGRTNRGIAVGDPARELTPGDPLFAYDPTTGPDGVIELYDPASRAWGRSATDAAGVFRFLVPGDASRLWAYVFARGLVRHQLTAVGLPHDGPFDFHLQGEQETTFFAL